MKTKFITTIFAAVTALTLVSCQSTSGPTEALTCSKCKTVWFKQAYPDGSGKRIVLRETGAMSCTECENAVATFFKTGQLKHKCKHCGDTLTHCTRH